MLHLGYTGIDIFRTQESIKIVILNRTSAIRFQRANDLAVLFLTSLVTSVVKLAPKPLNRFLPIIGRIVST